MMMHSVTLLLSQTDTLRCKHPNCPTWHTLEHMCRLVSQADKWMALVEIAADTFLKAGGVGDIYDSDRRASQDPTRMQDPRLID